MNETDYDAVVALWTAAGLPYRPLGRDSREHVSKEIRGPHSVFLVAERDGNIVGSLLGTIDGRKGWVNRLAVAPSQRNRGLAKALVAAAEEEFRSKDALVFSCLIHSDNGPSLALFKDLGYEEDPTVVYLSKREGPDS